MIRLYDTAQRRKVDFEPHAAPAVGIYVCGPTVYDHCHVGHARCYVAFDVIVRYLRHTGYTVQYVRNITNIDDKIINRAQENSEEPVALAERFTKEFHADMARLGNRNPDREPQVSDHLQQIIDFVQQLIEGGHAYAVGGDVYFKVGAFADYGWLSGRQIDDLRAGARVEVDERKENPLDFALWKSTKPGEPAWDSPWGPGRPGWHIECSAMSGTYLGTAFDIHGGGMDLIFPHHENEVAQSRALQGKTGFAKYWLHNGFINLRGEKMSKSLGNVFTIREVCRLHEPEALRLFLLGTHYRNPIAFDVVRTAEQTVRFPNLEEQERRLVYAYTTLNRLHEALSVGKEAGPGPVLPPAEDFTARFQAAMDDDFNTAAATGHASELLPLANKLLDQPKAAAKDVRRRTLQAIADGLKLTADVLGVWAEEPAAFLERYRQRICDQRGIDPAHIEQKLVQRTDARQAKDFAASDAIRAELTDLGIEVMDGPQGSSWRIIEEAQENDL